MRRLRRSKYPCLLYTSDVYKRQAPTTKASVYLKEVLGAWNSQTIPSNNAPALNDKTLDYQDVYKRQWQHRRTARLRRSRITRKTPRASSILTSRKVRRRTSRTTNGCGSDVYKRQVYNGTAYAYVKSLQGDIVAILDRKSTRLNSSHVKRSRMPSSA